MPIIDPRLLEEIRGRLERRDAAAAASMLASTPRSRTEAEQTASAAVRELDRHAAGDIRALLTERDEMLGILRDLGVLLASSQPFAQGFAATETAQRLVGRVTVFFGEETGSINLRRLAPSCPVCCRVKWFSPGRGWYCDHCER